MQLKYFRFWHKCQVLIYVNKMQIFPEKRIDPTYPSSLGDKIRIKLEHLHWKQTNINHHQPSRCQRSDLHAQEAKDRHHLKVRNVCMLLMLSCLKLNLRFSLLKHLKDRPLSALKLFSHFAKMKVSLTEKWMQNKITFSPAGSAQSIACSISWENWPAESWSCLKSSIEFESLLSSVCTITQ